MIKTLLKVKTLKIYNISLSTTAMYSFIGSETYIFYIFTFNKVLMHFKILDVFAFILHIYLYLF